ncbi:MAG TPA: HEAT repeat domain-containing protein, partial [bacterium]|nr:HEAT repeat domain-containing protein [bacterium]
QILVEQANRLYVVRELTLAGRYLETALGIAPQDESIRKMHELVLQETTKLETARTSLEENIAKRNTSPVKGVWPEPAGSEEAGFLKNRVKEMEALVVSLRKSQQSRLSQLDQSVFSQIVQKSEEENQKFFGWFEKKLGDMEKRQDRNSLYLIFGIVGGFGLLLLVLVVFFHAHIKRNERIILGHQEQLYALVFDRKEALSSGRLALLAPRGNLADAGSITVQEMLKDPNARVRARGVEVLEAELVDQDAELAERILSPFLNDPDNRVRGNACKNFFRFNPSKTLSVLKEMAESDSKWMRVSAAWVLGEIEAVEGFDILKKLALDSDDHVMKRALIAMCKIRESPKQNIHPVVSEEIDSMLDGHIKHIDRYKDELRRKAKFSEVSRLRDQNEGGAPDSKKGLRKKSIPAGKEHLFSGEKEGQALKEAQNILKKADELKDKWKKDQQNV